MKRFQKMALMAIALGCLLITLATGCGSTTDNNSGVALHITWDFFTIGEAIKKALTDKGTTGLQVVISESKMDDLRKGKCHAVLLGREPTEEELKNFNFTVIAYDAICVIIDDNSYMGGEWQVGNMPVRKTEGLRNLKLDDVRGIFSYYLCQKKEDYWRWSGELYSWKPVIDSKTGEPLGDPNSPQTLNRAYDWQKEHKAILCHYRFPVGKYDTQTAVYQLLGLDELTIAAKWRTFSAPHLNTEEEVISHEFPAEPPFLQGTQDFPFKIGFTSRRVLNLARQNGLPVKAININGINPVTEIQAIYDGTYPLSRKIYVVTPLTPSPNAEMLVKFLLAEEGQKLFADNGLLRVK